MDIEAAALIALAVLLFFVWRQSAGRLQELERKIAALTEANDDLQRLLSERMAAAETESRNEPAPPAAPAPQPAQAYPVVPVGTRQPAVIPPRPVAVIPAPTETEAETVPPEIVAVIMAAVAASGYSPAAIRAIRPKRRRQHTKWIMAGRLAGMR